jgi:hypothetical protein
MSIGHSAQIKMMKIAEMLLSERVKRERHPRERRYRPQHLNERIQRLVHGWEEPECEAQRHGDD